MDNGICRENGEILQKGGINKDLNEWTIQDED